MALRLRDRRVRGFRDLVCLVSDASSSPSLSALALSSFSSVEVSAVSAETASASLSVSWVYFLREVRRRFGFGSSSDFSVAASVTASLSEVDSVEEASSDEVLALERDVRRRFGFGVSSASSLVADSTVASGSVWPVWASIAASSVSVDASAFFFQGRRVVFLFGFSSFAASETTSSPSFSAEITVSSSSLSSAGSSVSPVSA